MSRSIEEAWKVLGVAADSDPETVAHAYRRLARATHPDLSTDPEAARRFAAVAAAYRLLADHARREASTATPSQGDREPDRKPLRWWGRPAGGRPVADDDLLSARTVPGDSRPTAPRWDAPPIVAGPVRFQESRREPFHHLDPGDA